MFKFLQRKKSDPSKSFDSTSIRLGGWQPDPPNKTYLRFDKNTLALSPNSNIQYKSGDDVDLRPYTSPRHSQKSTSSCVAQSLVKALEIKRIIKHGHANHIDLSVLDLYYKTRERMIPSMVDIDAGTYISTGCDILREVGVCRESVHPFSVSRVNERPPVMAFREARLNRITSHFKIKSLGQERLDDIIFNLKAGNPVVFGTTVGEDWKAYRGGSNPLRVETRPVGGHAMTCIGFINGLFVIENSWGSWGEDGFGYVDPSVFTHASTRDVWVIIDGSEGWVEK